MGKKRIIAKAESAGDGEAARNNVPEAVSAKAKREQIRKGVAHIQATYNNTMIMITDERGNAIAWSSAGALGFKGTKKATPYAAARAAEVAAEKAKRVGLEEIAVMVKGIGSGRDSAVRALANHGLNIMMIKDITPIPHNGPRPKKVRRV